MFKRCVLLSSLTLVACPAPAVFKCDPLTGQDCSGADGGLSSADGGSDAGRADGGPSADGGRIEVIGQRVSHFQGGTTRSPLDLTTFGLKVLTPESTFIEVSPVALDGGLAFEAIPEGIRYLRHGSSWTVGVNDRVDYTRHALGRPGIVVTDGGTRLRLAVSGLAPWVGQQLQLTAANANLFSFDTANFIQPSLGATSVTSDLDYVRLDTPAPLVDTSLGDVFTLAQFERTVLTTDGGTELYAHALARVDLERDISQHGLPCCVREGDVLEPDVPGTRPMS